MINTEVDELKDRFYDVALALEEMIVYQEGKLPTRMIDLQRKEGYNAARKQVLEESRTMLRKTKTYMLRAGIIADKPKTDKPSEPGLYSQSLVRSPTRTGQGMPDQKREMQVNSWARFATHMAVGLLFILGFRYRFIHTLMAGVLTAGIVGLLVYYRVVGVKA